MREKAQVTWQKKSKAQKREINAYNSALNREGANDDIGTTVTVFGGRRGNSICGDGGGGPWTPAREKAGRRRSGDSV